jgi:hypothetical protein
VNSRIHLITVLWGVAPMLRLPEPACSGFLRALSERVVLGASVIVNVHPHATG